jgi:DNA-binding response OmpR family regulator
MTDRNESSDGSSPLEKQAKPAYRILVVEDDPDIRRVNAVALQRAGYHVDTAEDGLAGWRVLQAACHTSENYDVLITDHDMPGLTGLALVQKSRAAHMKLPVILASGRLQMEELSNRYTWLQPAVTLIKPYSIAELLKTVKTILNTLMSSPKQTTARRGV